MSELHPLPYSTRTRVSLGIARSIAAARGDVDVTPLHVTLGLLREGRNGAVAALMHAGVNVHSLLAEIEADLGPPGRPQPEEVAVGLTSGEQRIIDVARTISRELADRHIGPEHILLALLRDEASGPSRVLARYGIDASTARTHVDAVIVKHQHPHSAPSKDV